MDKSQLNEADFWNEFRGDIVAEITQTRKRWEENSLMLDQSQKELNKLAKRNQMITAQLQQAQTHFDRMEITDIKATYQAVMDSQQRLLVMRAQVEKLKSDQEGLEKLLALLDRTEKFLSETQSQEKGGGIEEKIKLVEAMVDSQETVRQKLSHKMHDGPAQELSNFMIRVEIANRLIDVNSAKAKEELNELKSEAAITFSNFKNFITEVKPVALEELGLVTALKRYIESFKSQNNIDIALTIKGQERTLENYLGVLIFRAVQELLWNSFIYNQRHPGKVMVNVTLEFEPSQVKVIVSDNGAGFDVNELRQTKGTGLRIIRERVELLGGSMEVNAFSGKGCNVSLEIPCIEVFDLQQA